jgi:hypothetical protein
MHKVCYNIMQTLSGGLNLLNIEIILRHVLFLLINHN